MFISIHSQLPQNRLHRMSSLLIRINGSSDANHIIPIIQRDDDVTLKQSYKEHFLIPSSETSRASLSPILAIAVSTGAIRCAGAALLHGADPDFLAADLGGASLLNVAAFQHNDAMVSCSISDCLGAYCSTDKAAASVWCEQSYRY
jgi:hypothetical protein